MKITVEVGMIKEGKSKKPCEVEINCDKDGLDFLVRKLSKLKSVGDHTHLMTPSWGMYELSEEKLKESNELAHHLRITII